ncbi:hypothetical protein GCM10023210_23380 [Chryseobacterium ginsengisoli]|uniref:Uncharacterized protein n=2 Tax=Chryseobacterium ginsengisoli TaxID=363853 RepID=A0ABP9MED9_9FLAO
MPPISINRDEAKIALMDQLIITSNYEQSVKNYVSDYLWLHSEELKLTDSQKEQIKEKFNYKDFAGYCIYSSFNYVDNDKISKLIDFYKSIDGGFDKEKSMFLTDYYYSKLLNENILIYIKYIKKKNK